MTIDPFAVHRKIEKMVRDMTLAEACDHLRDMTRYRTDTLVTFTRHPPGPPPHDSVSVVEASLIEGGILRFARQEFGTRTYHVDYKRLNQVEEDAA